MTDTVTGWQMDQADQADPFANIPASEADRLADDFATAGRPTVYTGLVDDDTDEDDDEGWGDVECITCPSGRPCVCTSDSTDPYDL